MATIETKRLDVGDSFPSMTFHCADGSTQSFPPEGSGEYQVLLVYRGVW